MIRMILREILTATQIARKENSNMREWMLPLIASAIAVVLQIILAPVLTIFAIVPNFIVAFIVVLVIMRRPDSTYIYVFVLGLLADLLSQTPVGLTPLLLLVVAFVLSRVFEVLDDSNIAMSLIACVVALLVFELLFMIVLMILGYSGSLFELLVQRALPCALYDSVIAAVVFLIMRRLPFAQSSNDAWRVSNTTRFR